MTPRTTRPCWSRPARAVPVLFVRGTRGADARTKNRLPSAITPVATALPATSDPAVDAPNFTESWPSRIRERPFSRKLLQHLGEGPFSRKSPLAPVRGAASRKAAPPVCWRGRLQGSHASCQRRQDKSSSGLAAGHSRSCRAARKRGNDKLKATIRAGQVTRACTYDAIAPAVDAPKQCRRRRNGQVATPTSAGQLPGRWPLPVGERSTSGG